MLGILLGVLATRSSGSNLHVVVSWGALVSSTLIWATPLTFAAIGGMFSERSGVVNIGLEGMMLSGAFFGVLGADKINSWEMGLVLAAVAGGALRAPARVLLDPAARRPDRRRHGDQLPRARRHRLLLHPDLRRPGLSGRSPAHPEREHSAGSKNCKFLDNAFGSLNLMIWLSFVLLIVAYVVMFKTPIGLRIRAVGEHPRAAETVGIYVYPSATHRWSLSGMLAALGGAYLSIGFVGSFTENMTAGRGFIALAALIFGNWRPFGAFAAALLFGSSTRARRSASTRTPTRRRSLFQALPYLLTLIAVAGVIGRPVPPAAVGRPYTKQ